MLKPHFSITCDPMRDYVEIHVSGFFTVADVEAMGRDQLETYRRLRCPRNQHITLCDASGMKIQTQDVVAAFMAITNRPTTQARRLAVIVGSSLARLQTQRVSDRPGVRLFRERADAERWLFSDDDDAVTGGQTAARYPHVPALPMSAGHDYTARSVG